jgi:hypothetical protein
VVVVTIHGLEVEVPVIALHLSQNSVEFSLRRSIHLGRRLKNRVMQKARYHSVQLPRYFRSMDLWAFVSAASSLKPSFLKSVKFDPSSVMGVTAHRSPKNIKKKKIISLRAVGDF